MKCKDCCNVMCSHRTSDAEMECYYTVHKNDPLLVDLWASKPFSWVSFRREAAMRALQGLIANGQAINSDGKQQDILAKVAISCADALIEELKKG